MPPPTKEEIKEMILRHAKLQVEYKGRMMGIREMRNMWHGIPLGFLILRALRNEVNQVETFEELQI